MGQPTVILAKTIKGYGMGDSGEGQNITHQQKKMTEEALLAFRDRFELPLTDEQGAPRTSTCPRRQPRDEYLRERRAALGGSLPSAPPKCGEPGGAAAVGLPVPAGRHRRAGDLDDDGVRTGARHPGARQELGQRIVPIVPDESRTFGMEGMFRQLGIYSQVGQLYQPEDAEQLMFYKEDRRGQILQEGINEAGAISSWLAAATSYTNHGTPMIPFYIFYSMFGFQRVGDLAWAAGDRRAPRLPDRRHLRAHDAQRRGPAARGRAEPPARLDDPQLPRL